MARSQAGRAQPQRGSQRSFCWCQGCSHARLHSLSQPHCCGILTGSASAALLQGCAASQKTKVDTPSLQSPLPAYIPQATMAFFPCCTAPRLCCQPEDKGGHTIPSESSQYPSSHNDFLPSKGSWDVGYSASRWATQQAGPGSLPSPT